MLGLLDGLYPPSPGLGDLTDGLLSDGPLSDGLPDLPVHRLQDRWHPHPLTPPYYHVVRQPHPSPLT